MGTVTKFLSVGAIRLLVAFLLLAIIGSWKAFEVAHPNWFALIESNPLFTNHPAIAEGVSLANWIFPLV